MSTFIKSSLTKRCPISIDADTCRRLSNMTRGFEIRNKHPQLLNGTLLGVYDIKFLPDDRSAIFEIFDLTEDDVDDSLKSVSSLNTDWKVSSDSFNIFCIYILWNIYTSKLPETLKKDTMRDVALYFQYKLFSSVVNRHFKFGANEEIMTLVIESLSNKFAIKTEETWKKVMLKRVENLIHDKSSIHYGAISKFEPDKAITFAITDTQTRIRNQVNEIASIYYSFHEDDKRIKNAGMHTEVDGDRIIRDREASVDIMKSALLAQLKYGQVNEGYVKIVESQFTILSRDFINKTLLMFYSEYQSQLKNKTTEKVVSLKEAKDVTGATEHLIGIEAIVEKLISGSLDVISKHQTDMKNIIGIMNLLKRTYTASRLSNTDLLNVKYSMREMIIRNKITIRDATISSLVPGIELYFILASIGTISKEV